MKPDEMDAVFAALSSEPRRRILDVLRKEPAANVNRVCEFFGDMGRVAVLKHIDILEAANLVLSEKVGRERLLYFNPVPIHMIHDRWTTEYSAYWAGGLARLKYRIEKPVTGGIEVTLTVDDMPLDTRTSKGMSGGGQFILDNLKAIVETGRPPFMTRLMYSMMGALEFMLPGKTKTGHWPLDKR